MAENNTETRRQMIDYMARDYESFKQAMINLIPEKLPNWTDLSEADFGIVMIELFAYMADILSYYQDRIANESFLATARERRSIIQHLRLIGYELKPAAAASVDLSLVVSNNENGTITINKGDKFYTESAETGESVNFEYINEEQLKIPLGELVENSAGQGYKKYYPLPVKEGQTIKDEILGYSDGSPNQVFQLAQPRLLRDSLKLSVETSEPNNEWTLKDNLIYSRQDDKDYVIKIDENDIAWIYFGDRIYGKIPDKENRIIATYRVGGGRYGNVAKERNFISENAQLQSIAAKLTNEKAASGGEERETEEHAIKLAPSVFKSLERGVTKEDIEALALDFEGVGKAKAEPANWNFIDLYIAPAGGGVASDLFKKELQTYLEDKRMMTTLIRIKNPNYIKVFITAEVKIKSYYHKDAVQQQIQNSIKEKILNFDQIDFGQSIYLSKVYEAIEEIDGVDFVYVSEFRRELPTGIKNVATTIAEGGMINFGVYELPEAGYSNFIQIITTGGH